ncbi:MAG: FAD-dependent oxidoreductase [Cyclobacteriaceae bacterium]|nr:FAD-dependent oxidoreductase [Cyclobacteriaceae bacterium]
MDPNSKIYIIGAGVSGLVAAIELERYGYSPVILESSDKIGGRVKSDTIDGFILDHGFQVLLDAYPEAKHYLNYQALDLKQFTPGAIIFHNGKKIRFSDPLRNPEKILSMAFSSAGTLSDKLRLWGLNRSLKKKSVQSIFSSEAGSTIEYLKKRKFSDRITERFFKPFFRGIFLENDLDTSSKMFEFVFKMFGEGHATIPAKGMGEIAKQLSGKLQRTEFRFKTAVKSILFDHILLEDGEKIEADGIIIATKPHTMLSGMQAEKDENHAVSNLYFSLDRSFLGEPIIALVPGDEFAINNFCFMSDVSPAYAPEGKALLSVSVNGVYTDEKELVQRVIMELESLAGPNALQGLTFLKMYSIARALPVMEDLQFEMQHTATRIQDSIFLAGDYLLYGSLNAAMYSGRNAAIGLANARQPIGGDVV